VNSFQFSTEFDRVCQELSLLLFKLAFQLSHLIFQSPLVSLQGLDLFGQYCQTGFAHNYT
jgi:hypothetical protein